MPAVRLTDRETYKKAVKVLIQAGGPFQGRGEDTLIISSEQYAALVQARLVSSKALEIPSHSAQTQEQTDP
jgi:hypothetical protein